MALNGQDIVGAMIVEVFRVRALGLHRVCRHHHVFHVLDDVQQVLKPGDLVGFDADADLPKYRAGGVVLGGHQMGPVPAAVLGLADFFAVDGNDFWFDLSDDPDSEGGIENIPVNLGQHPLDCGAVPDADAGFGQGLGPGVGRPFSDLGERFSPGQDRADRKGQDPGQPVPDAPALPWIRDAAPPAG